MKLQYMPVGPAWKSKPPNIFSWYLPTAGQGLRLTTWKTCQHSRDDLSARQLVEGSHWRTRLAGAGTSSPFSSTSPPTYRHHTELGYTQFTPFCTKSSSMWVNIETRRSKCKTTTMWRQFTSVIYLRIFRKAANYEDRLTEREKAREREGDLAKP